MENGKKSFSMLFVASIDLRCRCSRVHNKPTFSQVREADDESSLFNFDLLDDSLEESLFESE